MTKPPKPTRKVLEDLLSRCSGIPAFERSTSRQAFARWMLFYKWAKDAGLDPLDKPEELLVASNQWRERNSITASPRTQRTVMREVFGKNRLPQTRKQGTSKAPPPTDAAGVLKLALRDTRAAIKRCEQGISKLSSDLERYKAELVKLEQMEKTLSS